MLSIRSWFQARLTLRVRLLIGYGSLLALFLLFGGLTAYEFSQIGQASAVVTQETQNVLAAQDLSRTSLELVIAIDKGILLQDGPQFAALVTPTLTRLEQQHQIVRATLTDTVRLDTAVESILSVVRPMLLQAQAEDSWQTIRDNRISRIDDKIDRLNQAIGDVVAVAQARQSAAVARTQAAPQSVYGYVLGAFIVALLLGAIAFVTIMRSVARSADRLAAAAGRLAAGQLDQRVIVETHDELGRLARVFNDMAAQLQALYASLEQRVTDRTADLERRARQLQAAAQVAREAAAIRDISALLNTTVQLISEQFGFYHAGLFLITTPEMGEFAVLQAASSAGGQRVLDRRHKLKLGEGIVGHVAQRGQARIVSQTSRDATFFSNPDLPLTRSEMALPLTVRERVIGVLDVQSTQEAAFDPETVAVLQTLADQVALAIDNTRLLQEAQERLHEVNVLLGRYGQAGWEQWSAARPNWAYVYDGITVTAQPPEPTPAGDSGLAVPLQVRDATIGRLHVGLPGRPATEQERALVQDAADRISQALENARLYQEMQRRAARERLVGEVTARIRASTQIETILQTSIRELGQVLQASDGLIRIEPGKETLS